MHEIEIQAADGPCRSFVFEPEGKGPWPALLVFMDGIAIRPAMLELGERFARAGLYVLMPDLFYRSGRYEPMDAKTVFSDPEQRKTLMEKFFALATQENVMRDVPAFLEFLASQPNVRPGKIAASGYCMGGLMALTAAGTYPDRFALVASFHGGRLATDAPNSPHLLAPKISARLYIAGAIEDASFPDDMKHRLDNALRDAGVTYTLETYPAKHGWVFTDTPAYDQSQSERHYGTLTKLLKETFA